MTVLSDYEVIPKLVATLCLFAIPGVKGCCLIGTVKRCRRPMVIILDLSLCIYKLKASFSRPINRFKVSASRLGSCSRRSPLARDTGAKSLQARQS